MRSTSILILYGIYYGRCPLRQLRTCKNSASAGLLSVLVLSLSHNTRYLISIARCTEMVLETVTYFITCVYYIWKFASTSNVSKMERYPVLCREINRELNYDIMQSALRLNMILIILTLWSTCVCLACVEILMRHLLGIYINYKFSVSLYINTLYRTCIVYIMRLMNVSLFDEIASRQSTGKHFCRYHEPWPTLRRKFVSG